MIAGLAGQMTYLEGLRTTGGAAVAPWGPGDLSLNVTIPATSITDIAPALGGRGGILLAAQSCYLHRTISTDPDQGALVMDAGFGGLNVDKMLIGQTQGDNYYHMLSEVARLAEAQDLDVTCGEIIHYIGTSSKGEVYDLALSNINLVWDQQQDWCEAEWGARPSIIAGQTGGDTRTTGDRYDVTMAQYDACRDRGGEIATSQRIWPINDNNIHTDVDVSVMIGEVIDWCRAERDAGRKWTPWASVTKAGATVTVAFDLRPGETLVNRPDFYDAHGGAALTAPDYGFEAGGGIVSVVPDLAAGTVTITLADPASAWFQFASQAQDVREYAVEAGGLSYNQSSHRTTLFPSETRASRFYPDRTLWRSLPSFAVLFSGDQVNRLDGTPFEGGTPAIPVFVPTDGRMIMSGHSLTDTVMSYPWPGLYHSTRESMIGASLDIARSAKSTIPGSSAAYRWDDPNDDLQSPNDARHDIALYDGMTITDRGNAGTGVASPDDADPSLFREDLTALRNFLFNALDNGRQGRATRYAYQTHWADLDGSMGDWRTVTLDYGRRALFRVQWLEHQARLEYSDLPGDFRIPIIPGHLLMVRIFDDIALGLVPGVSSFASLFKDTIHPLEDGGLLDTALAWLFAAVLHGENPEDYPTLAAGAQVTAPQAAYLKPVVWQIASTYAHARLGGTDDRGEVGYDPATDPDPLGDDPVEPGGDLPDFDVMEWTADGYSGPTLTGPQPSVSGDLLQFRGGTPLTAPITVGASAYGIAALRPVATTQTKGPIVVLHSSATWWQGAFFALTWNGYLGSGKYMAEVNGDVTAEPSVQSGVTPSVVEWWTDSGSISISVDGGPTVTTTLETPRTGSSYVTLFGQDAGTPEYDVTALGMASAIPDDAGRAAARVWANDGGA